MPRRNPPTTPAVPESSIQAGIKTLLELDGWRVFETDAQRRHHDTGSVRHPLREPGMADLLCLRYDGDWAPSNPQLRAMAEVMWIECKRPGEKPDTHQRIWINAERARGALVVVLGEDCECSIDSWVEWCKGSGLARRKF